MRLVSLKLTNFKGARDLTVVANGEDLSVFGENAAGKTTLFDAHLWLLFGKDSRNRTDFEIKTIDRRTGEAFHKLNHEVEGAYLLPDGEEVSLRRVYSEKWTKQRGSAHAGFTGHETTHYIDGVPKSKAEYEAFVEGICSERTFRLLSDPSFFCDHLKWEERRRMLVALVGDISDDEVIASDPKLAAVGEILGKHSADDKRAVLTSQRRALNEELRTLPTRIDEATRAAGQAFDGEAKDTSEADKKVAGLQTKLAEARNGGAVTQLRIELNSVVAKMQERETALKRAAGSGYDGAQDAVRKAQQSFTQAQSEVNAATSKLQVAESSAKRLSERLDELREELRLIKARDFVFSGTDTCPTCMRPLPPADVEAARAKAQSDFNEKQAREREANVEKGTAAKAALQEAQETVQLWAGRLAEAERACNAAEDALNEAKSAAMALERPQVDVAADDEYSALARQKAGIEAKIGDEQTASAEAVHAAEQELETAKAELAEIARHNAQVESAQSARDRVAELENQEQKVGEEFEQVEAQLFLIEEFARAKARLLTDRINSRFGLVTFKLFDEQINGGLAECCEAMVDNVPYSSLNHGSRLNAGLDIIDTLGRSQGFTPVVFIDNSESVTSIRPTQAQQIKLVVSAKDKALRFEGAQTIKQAS